MVGEAEGGWILVCRKKNTNHLLVLVGSENFILANPLGTLVQVQPE